MQDMFPRLTKAQDHWASIFLAQQYCHNWRKAEKGWSTAAQRGDKEDAAEEDPKEEDEEDAKEEDDEGDVGNEE